MQKKIIVIGGGVAGLASAIEARKEGYEVILFEKNPSLGGLCFSFERNGYYIDGCIHWLTGTNEDSPINKLWKEYEVIKNDEEIIKINSLISYKNKFHLYRNIEDSEKEWINNAPEDEEEIKKFFKLCRCFTLLQLASLNRPYEYLEANDVYTMVKNKYPKLLPYIDELRISREEYSKRFKNDDLRFFISNCQVGYNNLYCLLFVYTKFIKGDVDLLKGGTKELIKRLQNLYISLNGVLKLNEPVDEIIIDKDNKVEGIKTKNGLYKADYIIAALDPIYTLKYLLKNKYHYKEIESNYLDKDNYPLTSAFQLTFLLDENINIFDVSNVIKFKNIKIGKSSYEAAILRNYSYDKDDFNKNGKTIYHIFFNQNQDDYAYWMNLDKEAYIKEKEKIANDIKEALINEYPLIKESFEILDIFTPKTINRYTNATDGAYMSFPVNGKKNALFFSGKVPHLNNFIFANQYLSSPGGLPNALMNGKLAITRLGLKK